MLFSDFRACVPINIPKLPIAALTEFFYAYAETNIHPLPVLWYFIYSLWRFLCSCMHIMSMLWCIAETVSYGSLPILFKVLTLNVSICIVLLHFSNFCFSLSSIADFSYTVLSCHKVYEKKKMNGSQGNSWWRSPDTWWGVILQWNSEEDGYGIKDSTDEPWLYCPKTSTTDEQFMSVSLWFWMRDFPMSRKFLRL